MIRTLRAVIATLAALAVVITASGWLYILRPATAGFPGPRVRDALPLDELSRLAGVPLLVFVAVWGTAAILLALIVRALRLEPLTAGLLLALGVGAWGYLASSAAIIVVRQVTADEAFQAATKLEAVYLPAALAGIAGALLTRGQLRPRPRAPLVLAWAVAVAGGLGVLYAILPESGHALVAKFAPEHVHGLSTALIAPLGFALLLLARGLARRQRRAWQLALVVVAGLAVLQLQHLFGYGAVLTGLVAVALVARRGDFDAPGDPESHPRVAIRLLLLAGSVFAYGASVLWVNRLMADRPYTLGFALRETARGAAGLDPSGSAHLAGTFGEWFPFSVLLITIVGFAGILIVWLAPWRYRLKQGAHERELVRDLVATWGVDTLAPFVLRADKSYFFSEDERAFLAYRVVGGVAIVSGDPIGPPGEFQELIARFIEFARRRNWRLAVLGASEGSLELYRSHGLHSLYHGDEAVINVEQFSLEGRPIRKVRQSVHRLERAGYHAEVVHPRELGVDVRAELEAVAREWRGGEPQRGFVMALDALFRLEDEDAVFVIGRDPDGKIAGFLHFAVCPAAKALSLSSMPRLRTTPNGLIEWLVCEAVAWARTKGIERVSLNFAPFAAVLAPEVQLSALQRLERRALLRLKGRFQLDNLLVFNRKFHPAWERRFVVYERRLDLPRVGIAALAAEAYLPGSKRDA